MEAVVRAERSPYGFRKAWRFACTMRNHDRSMLTLFRRHLDTCPHRDQGRAFLKCDCPIHCDGMVKGRRIRESMNTSNWGRATRRMAELEEQAVSGRARKPVADAVAAFLGSLDIQPSSMRKYRRILTKLQEHTQREALFTVDRIGLEDLDRYRATRELNALSWSKELQLLRTFFAFCLKRKWTAENPAKEMDMPSDPKPRPRHPYTDAEVASILAACNSFGQSTYERSRARAMILLMKYFGLRVSDVATFERDRIRDGQVFINAMKNGTVLWLPMRDYPEVEFALEALPVTTGASLDCRYYFWTGLGSRDGHIKTIDRTLQAVFRKSGVKGASAHRFRHTLATKILVNGGSIEDAANMLGDSPAVIRKHYAKWSSDYQRRTVALLRRVHGTPLAHGNSEAISSLDSGFMVVLEEGVEPSYRVNDAGF